MAKTKQIEVQIVKLTLSMIKISNFKVVEFDHFKMGAGLPGFVLSPSK